MVNTQLRVKGARLKDDSSLVWIDQMYTRKDEKKNNKKKTQSALIKRRGRQLDKPVS